MGDQILNQQTAFGLRGLMSYGSLGGMAPKDGRIELNAAQIAAFEDVAEHYSRMFTSCAVVGAGAMLSIYAGQTGILTGKTAYWFSSQGWNYMELGRAVQILLLAAFSLWTPIIYRCIRPWLTAKNL